MSLVTTLLAGRAAAERNMTSTVKVSRLARAFDEATGTYADSWTTVYEGPGKLQFFDNAYEQTPVAGGHTFITGRQMVHLPVGASGIQVDDVVEVVADALNPGLLGRTWRVTNTPAKSHQTALRFPVEEVLQ